MCTRCAPLRLAAFGPRPGADAFPAAGAADPRARWLAAVVLGGQGHYAAAATVLRALLAHPHPLWGSLAASTLASHRRQLGAHAAARHLDALALRLATAGPYRPHADPDAVDPAGARTDALIGLAADALGLGDLPTAHRLLAAAEPPAGSAADKACPPAVSGVSAGSVGRVGRFGTACSPVGDGVLGVPVQLADRPTAWRSAVRLGWVRAELALAAGDAHAAVTPARDALRLADEVGAVRHGAKSRLVLAAALHAAGEPRGADELLHAAVAVAAEYGMVPLRWPAELLLAELHGPPNPGATELYGGAEHGRRHRAAASAALQLVLRRADVTLRTAAESSRWVPSEVLQTGDSAERSSAGEILSEICTGLCQGSTPRDR